MAEKSLKKNALLNIIRQTMGIIFPLITFPYSSRILGPTGIGKVNFSNSIVSYFAMIAALGITSYASREAAKVRDNKIEFTKLSKEIITINLISTFFAYIVFFISIFVIPAFSQYKNLLLIFSVSIIFNTLGVEWLYLAVEDFFYITLRSIFFQVLSLILLFTTVKTQNDLIQYASLMVISSTGSNLLNFIHSRKYLNFFYKTDLELKKHIKPICIMFGMALTASVFTMLDSTMVGFLSTDTQVGYYSASIKMINLTKKLIIAINAVLLPRVSYLYEKDKEKYNSLLIKGYQITLFLAFPAVCLLLINGSFVIRLLAGSKFNESIICLYYISPVILLSSVSLVVDNQIFIPTRKEKLNLYALIIGAVTDFILNLLLIPKYGAKGACIGTLTAEFFMFIYHFYFLVKQMGKKVFYDTNKPFIVPILIFLTCIFFIFVFNLTNPIYTIPISIVISLLYVFIIFKNKNSFLKNLVTMRN